MKFSVYKIILLSLLFSGEVNASCGIPVLISKSEQEALKSQVKFEYRDMDFLESDGVDYIEAQIPAYFNELEVGKVNLTMWDRDKLIYSAVLGEVGSKIRNRDVSRFEFTVNSYSNLKPKLSIFYGGECNNGYQFVVDEFHNYNVGFKLKKWEGTFERRSSILLRKGG